MRKIAFSVAALAACLVWLQGTCVRAGAESDTTTNSSAGTAGATRLRAPMPPLPHDRSPIYVFRQLLLMSPSERTNALAGRPSQSRDQILAKVREYESLPPNVRELRLKATELRYYLVPLMHSPASNRPAQLLFIPEGDRELVLEHLKEWDCLSAAQQQELLDNEAALHYLTELQSGSEEHGRRMRDNISAAQREKLGRSIAQWQAMPMAQRTRIVSRFDRYFELTPAEQEKALKTLSEPERKAIEDSLTQFAALAPAQRRVCIDSFKKFTSLTTDQRVHFLRNAEQWEAMTPDQRQAWRNLVKLLPPLPAGFDSPPPPPLPKDLRQPSPSPVVTNNL